MRRVCMSALVAMSVSGCLVVSVQKSPEKEIVYVPAGAPSTNPSPTELDDRLRAAGQMSSFDQRSIAYSKLAVDAANVGNTAVARRALAGITSFDQRAKASEEVALRLAARGQRGDAIEVARDISDFNTRDRVLGKLAGQ